MRKISWKIIVLITVLIMSGPAAFSKSFVGTADLSNNVTDNFVNGERISSSSSFRRNFSLRLSKPVTPILSYNLNLRANLTDSDTKSFLTSQSTSSFQRTLVPEIDVLLRNNIYNLSTGYRRQEQWSTAHYSNSSKVTTEFLYSRFSIVPQKLPSLSINLDRQKTFDHLAIRENYSTNDAYKIGTSYNLPSSDLRFGYNLDYSGSVNKTPLSTTAKTEKANFGNNYNIGYTGFLLDRKISYSAGYRGNYTRNRNTRYLTQTGSLVEERTANNGFNAQNTDRQVALSSNGILTDDNLTTSAGVDLNSVSFNHIGIQILFGKTVDRIYVYVDRNLINETKLNNLSNWEVYKSNENQAGSWTAVSIQSVAASTYDALNNLYRYEIEFQGSEEAFYFKVINLDTSSVSGVNVTEIEAYGTDEITDIGASTTVSKSFIQGLDFSTGYRPAVKWYFGLKYSVNRTDQNPVSVTDSMGGIFENIFSKSMDNENALLTSKVSRSYGANAKWLKSSLFNTTMRIDRNESFDSTGDVNTYSNSYNFSLNYAPLQEFVTTFSALRSERYNFNTKDSVSDSLLLSMDTKLFRDVNMITDMGYSQSNSLSSGTETSSNTISSSLDAHITRKLSGTLDFGFSRITSDTSSSSTEDISTSFNYQAGRLISYRGDFSYVNSAGNEDIAEGIAVDWLPLPRIRLNVSYRHSDSDPGPSTTDSVNSYGSWYITKFADIRLSYTYTRNMTESEAINHNINTNLNCRF